MTPTEVTELGEKLLGLYYPMVSREFLFTTASVMTV